MLNKELFASFQMISFYKDEDLPKLLDYLESHSHHLTASIVSNDIQFVNHIIKNTCNGVTYSGLQARTTGAPQNHWFGPGGDIRGSGIGTKEAILSTWTYHREIVRDYGAYNLHPKEINQS